MSTVPSHPQGPERGRTHRETDAFRELVESSAGAGSADWCSTLLLCAADLAVIPEAAVFLRTPTGGVGAAVATDPQLLSVSAALASGPWGPLARCVELRETVSVGAELSDDRSGSPLMTLGFAGVHLFPVRHGAECHGAVMLCGRVPNRLSPRQSDSVDFISGVAGLLLCHARERDVMHRTVSQLQHALDSRVVIEQAKGYVAGRDGGDIDGAFRTLREAARNQRRPLADVARETLPVA